MEIISIQKIGRDCRYRDEKPITHILSHPFVSVNYFPPPYNSVEYLDSLQDEFIDCVLKLFFNVLHNYAFFKFYTQTKTLHNYTFN